MKGHGSGSGNRGRPYVLMLILAFGAAIFGVMVLHRLRERRIFNLIVKEKDTDLISLHLLLQKERDQNRETKRKTESMRAKIYSLRTQKGELDSRISEMRSTISSLKDEQRVIELALDEKEREIKMLHDREKNSSKEDPRVVDLTERLKQKEAEIEDLKRRLQYPANVWSVSTDDPSKGMVLKDTAEANEIEGKIGRSHESTGYRSGENPTTGADGNGNEDRRENRVGLADRREMVGEHSQKLETSQGEKLGDGNTSTEKSTNEVLEKITEHSQTDGLGVAEENNNANATEAIRHGGEISKTRDDISDVMDGKEHEIAAMGQLEKLNVQDGQLGVNSKGGMTLEMSGNSQTDAAGYTVRHKHGHAGRNKGKGGRTLAKNPRYESNEEMSTEGRQSVKNGMEIDRYKPRRDGEPEKLRRHHIYPMRLKMKEEFAKENGKVDANDKRQENRMEMQFHDLLGSGEREEGTDGTNLAVNSTDIKLPKPQNFVENARIKVGDANVNQEIGRHEMDVQYENSETLHQTADTLLITDRTAGDAGEQKMGELREPEEQVSAVQQEKARKDVEKVGNDFEAAKVADKYEDQEEDSEAADIQEARKEIIGQSMSSSEEEKEEYKEQTEEPEF